MAFNDAMLSSERNDWKTPESFFRLLDELFLFELDPCSAPGNDLGLPIYYTEAVDGLTKSWKDFSVYANPPYGRTQTKFVNKAILERDAKTVMLIPARPDTKLWQDVILPSEGIEVLFLRGRLKFVGAAWPAPFPCALLFINNPLTKKHRSELRKLGTFR